MVFQLNGCPQVLAGQQELIGRRGHCVRILKQNVSPKIR
jgi:hypothetical protein